MHTHSTGAVRPWLRPVSDQGYGEQDPQRNRQRSNPPDLFHAAALRLTPPLLVQGSANTITAGGPDPLKKAET